MAEIEQDYRRGSLASVYGNDLPESLQPRPFNRPMEPSSEFSEKIEPWDESQPIPDPPDVKDEMEECFENYDSQNFPPNMEWSNPSKYPYSQNTNNWTQSTHEKNWIPSQQNNAHNNQNNPIPSQSPMHNSQFQNRYREPQYPNSNPGAQYPNRNHEAPYPNNNRPPYQNNSTEPQYPNSNHEPRYPKTNQEVQYANSNRLPPHPNSNPELQFPNSNHGPQYANSNQAPPYPNSNHELQHPMRNKEPYYQNNYPEPQHPKNYLSRLNNFCPEFSQNHSGPHPPNYQNQDNINPQPNIELGKKVLNLLADRFCPIPDTPSFDLRQRLRREPAQYCDRAQKRRKFNLPRKSLSYDKETSSKILNEEPFTAPDIEYSNYYDPESTQIAFYTSPNRKQTNQLKESFLHRPPISTSTPINSNPNSSIHSPSISAVDEITGLPGGMSPEASTRSVTPIYHGNESFSDSGVSTDDESDFPFETKCHKGAYPVSQIPFIDAHCHIDYIFVREKHYGSFNSYIKTKEFPKNFSGCIANFCDPAAWGEKKMYEAVLEEDGVWAAFGLHPHNADKYNVEIEEQLVLAASHPKCVAWGEMGLDFGVNGKHDPEGVKLQSDVFRKQIKQGLNLGKPFVIHGRGATEEIFEILKDTTPEEHKIHFHCYDGEASLVERMTEHFPNLYIGFTGLVTYDQNKSIQSVVRVCPLDRILVETDAPYMRPARCSHIDQLPPNSSRDAIMRNNKMCHPGMGMIIAAKIANLRGLELDAMLIQLRDNIRDMYGV